MNEMTTKEIRKALASFDPKRFSKRAKPFYVLGYTHSNGTVYNYSIAPYWSDKNVKNPKLTSYYYLVCESIEQAKNGLIKADYAELGLTEKEWNQSIAEQLQAWEESVKRYGDAIDDQLKGLIYVPKGNYYTDPKDPDVTILIGRRLIYKEAVTDADAPPVVADSSLNSANAIVRGKALVRKVTPVGLYLPRLNLRPSNVRCVIQ